MEAARQPTSGRAAAHRNVFGSGSVRRCSLVLLLAALIFSDTSTSPFRARRRRGAAASPFFLYAEAATTTTTSTQQSGGGAGQAQAQAHDNENLTATSSRRVKNLDHWDAATLAAYFGMDHATGDPLPVERRGGGAGAAADEMTMEQQPMLYDAYQGYDAAVLFYAQWCPNCHALAPLYDQIATLIHAGTTKSNVIMALFDCEKDAHHQMLCTSAGVTHYPTLMFVGANPSRDRLTRKEREYRGKKRQKLRRATKFRGNWQYGEQIMDWIRVCHGLSSWYRFSRGNPVMRFLRGVFRLPLVGGGAGGGGSGVAGGKNKAATTSLPVGIPGAAAASMLSPGASAVGGGGSAASFGVGGAGATATGTATSADLFQLKTKLEQTESKREEMERAAGHAAMLIDSILFPTEEFEGQLSQPPPPPEGAAANHSVYVDTFAEITARGAWDPYAAQATTENVILRSCMADLALDYCTRLTTRALKDDDFLSSFPADVTLEDVEAKLYGMVNDTEPFCMLIDTCILNDFDTSECQPDRCPFRNDAACRYVSACVDPLIQAEYRKVLSLDDNDDAASTAAAAAGAAAAATGDVASKAEQSKQTTGKKAGGWGMG